MERARLSRRVIAGAAFGLAFAAACHGRRGAGPVDDSGAPIPSVISIGVGIGTCPDVEICERECDAGSADRCRRLGATYAFGQGVTRDEPRATALYERACEMGDPPACVFAGQMREYAHGVPKDEAAAARLYERACDARWVAGCYNLAIMLESGRGVARDEARAAALYDEACRAGAKPACDRPKRPSDAVGDSASSAR